MPPMKPTFCVLLASAAATPTRYEPSSSRKVTESTLSPLTTLSMIMNRTLGNSLETVSTALVMVKPIATTMSTFLRARLRITCSDCESLLICASR